MTNAIEELVHGGAVLRVNIESLPSSVFDLHSETSDLRASIAEHHATIVKDGEHIRALVRVAEIHERRLTDLDGSSISDRLVPPTLLYCLVYVTI